MIAYKALPHYRYGVFRNLSAPGSGMEVVFVAGDHAKDDSIPTIPLTTFPNHRLLKNHFVGKLMWQSGLLRQLVRERPDSVIFTGDATFISTWVGAALARALGATVFFWTIGWHRPESGVKRIVRLSFYRLAHCLLLYGETGREIGIEMGYPASRMRMIYNSFESNLTGLEPQAEESRNTLAELPNKGLTIGAVVRLNWVKKLDMIVEAAGILSSRGIKVSVLLVGEGPARPNLAALASRLGVSLSMPGAAYSADQLRKVYEQMSLTVVPEVAGLTVMQSLSFGTPVITNGDKYGQAPEAEAVVPGETGDFYRVGDVDDLANTIERWLSHVASSNDLVADRCRLEISERWSTAAQAKAIRCAVLANRTATIRSPDAR